jgi:IS30 family transposase
MKAGHDLSQLAKLLERHKSTVSRELGRNIGSRVYHPKQACEMSAFMQSSQSFFEIFGWIH